MADENVDQRIGDYFLIEKLGCGSFGCVYKARHSRLPNCIVAMKVFIGNVDSKQEREQFLSEAQLLDQLRHPSILSIFDVGVQENPLDRDIAYIITEFAPHGSLRDRLDSIDGPMPLDQAFQLLTQIGVGLSYAHAQNVIHRDLKPENILFNDKGEALLADFGIAIVLSSGSRTGDRFGTPAYMAPEQFEGVMSRKSDQYALACIAYELFTGHHPFAGLKGAALVYQQIHGQPKRPRLLYPTLPVTIENALLRALEKDRKDRYPDIASFLTALQSTPSPRPLRPASSLPQRPWPDILWDEEQQADQFLRRNRGARSKRRQRLSDEFIIVQRRRPPVRNHGPSINPPLADPSPRLHRFSRSPVSCVRFSVPPPPPVKKKRQRDWPLIQCGVFGWLLVGLAMIALGAFPHMAIFWFIVFLLTLAVGGTSLLFCFVQALVSSYRAREWQWFAGLLVAPLSLSLFWLFLGLGGGFVGCVVIGIVLGTIVSMAYGWQKATRIAN